MNRWLIRPVNLVGSSLDRNRSQKLAARTDEVRDHTDDWGNFVLTARWTLWLRTLLTDELSRRQNHVNLDGVSQFLYKLRRLRFTLVSEAPADMCEWSGAPEDRYFLTDGAFAVSQHILISNTEGKGPVGSTRHHDGLVHGDMLSRDGVGPPDGRRLPPKALNQGRLGIHGFQRSRFGAIKTTAYVAKSNPSDIAFLPGELHSCFVYI